VNPVHVVSGLLASGIAALTVVATQGMTGREAAGLVFVGYSAGWFLLFGVAASLPTLIRAAHRRLFGRAFLAYGAGGALAGALTAVLLLTHQLGGSPAAVMVAFAIPAVLPWGLGALIMTW
jgi:hypothetical protein